MSKFLDFEEIKASVSLEDAAKRLGLELKAANGALRGKCPVCEATSDRNLVLTPGKGYYCFADGKGGDVIALAAHIRKCSPKDAAQFLVGNTVPEKRLDKSSEGFRELDYLETEHPAIDAVGFPHEVAEALGIGHAPRGVLKGTVAVPLRLPGGKLVGYIGITDAKLPNKWHL
jgi:hypothetical protein